MTNTISPISFNGLKIEGVVSAKNIKKIRVFSKEIEKSGFLEDLEKTFNTDLVLNNSLDTISFSHKVYGDLAKYKCPALPAKTFFSQIPDVMSNIKLSIKKAERSFKKEKQKYNSLCRGC